MDRKRSNMRLNKRWKSGLKISAAVLLTAWIFICQFMLQDRVSDNDNKNLFSKKGISLYTSSFAIGDRHLHYARVGAENLPTLVFIHGSPGSLSHFRNYLQGSQLIKRYRMFAIDRPGFGYSDFGNTTNLLNQAKYISTFIDSIDNKKPIFLVGHSIAGGLLIKLAALDPNKINGLVMLACSVDPKQERNGFWRPIITYSPLRWLIPVAFRYSNEEQWGLNDDLEKLKADFPSVKCPVYIFHGDADKNVSIENAYYAKTNLFNAAKVELTVLSGEDHFIVWSRYEEIRNKLLSLLNDKR